MNDEELDAALARLPEHDVDPWRAQRILRRARAALTEAPPSRGLRFYRRTLEPVMLAAFCALHLIWAFAATVGVLLH